MLCRASCISALPLACWLARWKVVISGNPRFIDGGGTSTPTFAYYETDGTWGIEGHGVDPDIEVIDDPSLMTDGGDPQLDAAITHMLEELNTTAQSRCEPIAQASCLHRNRGFGRLEACVTVTLRCSIKRNPYTKPQRPSYPNRSGMGVTEEDR